MPLSVVILAAGKGTRMKSRLPKVLHTLAGRPLLAHVIATAKELAADSIHVVYGHEGERVRLELAHEPVNWVEQSPQHGTGHALDQAMPAINDGDTVLVLYGDVPLTTTASLRALLHAATSGMALLTAQAVDPRGYGRIVRDASGAVRAIVEHKDASEAQRAIREINTGILAAPATSLRSWLRKLDNDNASGEYYLTDVIALAVDDGVQVNSFSAASFAEFAGVNDRLQLAQLEREYQTMQADELMRNGVTLRDPARFDLRGELRHGSDVVIDVNVILEGRVRLGDGVVVGANVILRDCEIGDNTLIDANSIIEGASVGADCRIGPFARIRPETQLSDHVHIGNFVELKKSQVAAGSKINHLSYIGDSEVGAGVNIGAGTITCNYDGANKHRTVIGDHAFIGSDTQLIAPVNIGAGATIGAGSTITQDAPAEALTLSRSKQKSITGWKRPVKEAK